MFKRFFIGAALAAVVVLTSQTQAEACKGCGSRAASFPAPSAASVISPGAAILAAPLPAVAVQQFAAPAAVTTFVQPPPQITVTQSAPVAVQTQTFAAPAFVQTLAVPTVAAVPVCATARPPRQGLFSRLFNRPPRAQTAVVPLAIY